MRGYGSEDDPATFSDMEAIVLEKSGKGGAAAKETMQEWQARYRRQLPHIEHLEQVNTLAGLLCCSRHSRRTQVLASELWGVQAASASTGRELDRLGAMACLCGRNNRFLIKNSAVSLGRATDVTQVGRLATCQLADALPLVLCPNASVDSPKVKSKTLKAAVHSAST